MAMAPRDAAQFRTDGRLARPVSVFLHVVVMLVLALGLVACDDSETPAEPEPYLKIVGGGFIFNYRVADAFYGFIATPLRSLPEGSRLVAQFEDPAGGPPFIEQQDVGAKTLRYSFRSPPLQSIKAGQAYHVELRLIAAEDGALLETLTRSYTSQIGQEINPDKPLTVGPGYHPNPEAESLEK